jgi:hypothetical protein
MLGSLLTLYFIRVEDHVEHAYRNRYTAIFAQKNLFLREKFHSYAFFVNFVTRYKS